MGNGKSTRRFIPRVLAMTLTLMMLVTMLPGGLLGTALAAGALSGVTLSGGETSLAIGASTTFSVNMSYSAQQAELEDAVISDYSSSEGSVASVSLSGGNLIVSGLAPGQSTIKVWATQAETSTTVSDTVVVSVYDPNKLTSLALGNDSVTIDLGAPPVTRTVSITLGTEGSPSVAVTAESGDTGVATVSGVSNSSFTVTGVAGGATDVKVTAKYKGTVLEKLLHVTVIPAPVDPNSVKLTKYNSSDAIGDVSIALPEGSGSATAMFDYEVLPANVTTLTDVDVDVSPASGLTASPDSSSSRTGSVTLTASAAGNWVVTVTTNNNKSASFNVSATRPEPPEPVVVPATDLELGTSELTMAVNNASGVYVPFWVLPSGYTSPASVTVSTSSSNPAVAGAAVDGSSVKITSGVEGDAVITVTAQQIGVSKTIAVHVRSGYVEATGMTFTPQDVSMHIAAGETSASAQVVCSLTPSNTSDSIASIAPNKTSVVTIGPLPPPSSKTATIALTALGRGEATITVTTVGGVTKSFNVTVTQDEPASSVPATDLQLGTSEITMAEGNAAGVYVPFWVLPSNYTSPTPPAAVSVSSSNPEASSAVVDGSSIKITSLAAGDATVTVTVNGTDISKTIQVHVRSSFVPVTGVAFTPESVAMHIPLGAVPGSVKAQVLCNFTPAGATDTIFNCASSNQSVVTITNATTPRPLTDPLELVAVGRGEATVTVTTASGFTSTFDVTVTQDEPAAGITATDLKLGASEITMQMENGTGVRVPFWILPDGYTIPDDVAVTPVSSNDSFATATVDGDDILITSGIPGDAVITVTADELGVSKTILVHVLAEFIPATGVAFTPQNITLHIPAGAEPDSVTGSVSCNFTPEGTTDFLFDSASGDESVVKLQENAPMSLITTVNLIAVGPGTTTVTVTTLSGFTATFDVTVILDETPTPPVTAVDPIAVEPDDPTVRLFKGDAARVFFRVENPAVLPDADIEVSSRDGKINAAFESIGSIPSGEEAPDIEGVWVTVQALEAGEDMLTLSVNGVEGAASVTIYDKIQAKDVSITPVVADVTSGDSVPLAIAGLDAFSTEGYTFLWSVPAPTLAQIGGAPGGTSIEVITDPTYYGNIVAGVTVTPPTGLDGTTVLPNFTLNATIRAHREGELVLTANLPAIDTINELNVGEGVFIPSGAFILQCWKDGALAPVATSSLTFQSSDTSVVLVDDSGSLMPVGKGTATITVTGMDYLNPDKTPATTTFTVQVTQLPTGISAPAVLETKTGHFLTIPASLFPANAEGYLNFELASGGSGAFIDDNVFYSFESGMFLVTIEAYASFDDYLDDEDPLFTRMVLILVKDEPTWLAMNDTAISIHVGDQYVIDLDDFPAYVQAIHGTITGWVSENEDALGFGGSDTIVGKAPCVNQYVYATTSTGYRLYFKFSVTKVDVEGITIMTPGEPKLLVGEIRQFGAIVLPYNADEQRVIWSTSDPTIASVDDLGNVTGHKPGTVLLYAASPEGPKNSAVLTVIRKADGILLDSSIIEGYPGDELPLNYQVINPDAEVSEVEWDFGLLPSVPDPGTQWVAGYLMLPENAAPGEYVITVSVYGTARATGTPPFDPLEDDVLLGEDSCIVRVLKPVEAVELANSAGAPYGTNEFIKGIAGRSIIVRALIDPEDASDPSLLWEVEDPNVATVTPIVPFGSYARVTYVGPGSTHVIVKSAQSDAADRVEVQVVNEVTDFTLSPASTKLYPGESFTYEVTLVPSDTLLINSITYLVNDGTPSTSDDPVAVNENGMVTALRPGKATIEATYDNGLYTFKRTATVEVKNPVDKMTFEESGAEVGALNLQVGGQKNLLGMLKIVGLDATKPVADSSIVWVVEKPGIVNVDSNGILRALAVGNSWVFAYAHNGVFAKIYIDINQNAQGLTLDAYNVAIWPGETAAINATLLPADSTDVLEWTIAPVATGDPAIILQTNADPRSFSFQGVNPGVTTVTATVYDAQSYWGPGPKVVTAQKICTVTVKQPIQSLTVESLVPAAVGAAYPKHVTANYLGQKILMLATAAPANTYDKSVTWSSQDSDIAVIDPISGMMTAMGVGDTVITATSNSDPSVKGTINVTVVRGMLSFELDPIEKSLYPTESFVITPALMPEGSALPTVKYAIDDTSVASIRAYTSNGVTLCKVTGLAAGTATITATIFEGEAAQMSATCEVEVLTPLTTFAVKKDRIKMLVGDAYRYDLAGDLIFNGDGPTDDPKNKAVTYTSRKPEIATVDALGQIVAQSLGTTVIDIVPSANTGLRAEVTVEVVELASGILADAAEIRVYPGQKIPVNFTFVPETIASSKLLWSYEDDDGNPLNTTADDTYAYFKDGFVYTVKPGFVKMTATVEIPNDIVDLYSKYPSLQLKEATATILVTVLQPVDSVEITTLNDELIPDPLPEDFFDFEVGDKFILGAQVLPADATDPELFWTSSDPNIASVDSFGIVSINGTGTAKIYATSKNSGAQDSVTLTIEKAPYVIKFGKTTVNNLFVRNAPSLMGTIYTKFKKKGTAVVIVGETSDWYEIQYSKGVGGIAYVNRFYVKITGTMQQQTLTPGTIVTTSNAIISSTTTVTANPGSGYRTTAPAGTRVLLLGKTGSYYRISYGHYNLGVGYIRASAVTPDPGFQYGVGSTYHYVPNDSGGYDSYIIDPGTGASKFLTGSTRYINIPSSVTADSAPIYSGYDPAVRVLLGRIYKGTGLTIISDKMNGFYQIRLDTGVVGWVEAIYLAKAAIGGIETTTTVRTVVGKTTTKVNLREGPSTSTKKLATLNKNTVVTLVNETTTNGFFKVTTAAGKVGYIASTYLKISTVVKEQTTITPIYEQYGLVNCKILNVRELGSLSGVIIDTLTANQQVRILSELNGWYNVELPDGGYGYVKAEFITLTAA